MSPPAHHTQTPYPQLSSTFQTKFVDNAKPAKEIGAIAIAIAGIGARAKADEHRRQVAERRRDKAERKRKRNRPVRNPWSDERKAAARARRAAKVAEAVDLICKPAAARANLGLPEPTREQREIAWSDYLKYMRDWKIERGEITEDDDEPWVDNSKYNRARAADGFVGKSDDLACGKYPGGPFEEYGLRSEAGLDSDPLFFAMATSTPKAGRRRSLPRGGDDRQRLRAGRTKDERPIMWGKMQALDNEYIDTLDSMWTWVCIDLDQDFDSEDELREHIRAKVRPGRLACEPHHVVCALGDGDELLHPHVWWKLPAGLEVYNDPTDKFCRNAPRRLYEGVATGICVELEDLGADAGHLGNPRGGKNPCSPRLHTFVWNVTEFPTLEQWSRHVNVWHKRDHVVREQVMRAAGTPGSKSMSQEVFTQAVGEAYRMLHAANKASEAIDDLRERTEKLLADLRARFAGRDFGPKVTAADIDAVLRTVARYVAEDWAPWRTAPVANRGRAYHLVRDIRCRDENGETIPEGVAARQSMGGKVGPAIKMAKTLDMIVTAMEKLAAEDRELTLTNVTPLVDRNPRTVKNNWKHAQRLYFSGSDPTEFSCLIGGSI